MFALSDILGSLNIQYATSGGDGSNTTSTASSFLNGLGGGMKCVAGSLTSGLGVPLPVTDLMVNLWVLLFNGAVVAVFWVLYTYYKKNSRSYMKQRLLISSTVLLYMMYPNFVKLFFQLFSCRNFPPETFSRLQGSLNTICFDADHIFWIVSLAIPVGIIIVGSLPVVSLVTLNHLRKTRKDGLSNLEVVSTLGFLYDGFRMDCWYWEIVVLARKIALSMVSVFLSVSTREDLSLYRQGLAALFIMVASLCIHLRVSPYRDLQINRLEEVGLSVSSLTLFCGMLTFDNTASGTMKSIVSVAVVGMNLVWLLCVLKIMYSGLKVYTTVVKYCCCCCFKRNGAGEGKEGASREGDRRGEATCGSSGGDQGRGYKTSKVMNQQVELAAVDVPNPLRRVGAGRPSFTSETGNTKESKSMITASASSGVYESAARGGVDNVSRPRIPDLMQMNPLQRELRNAVKMKSRK
jgi:hypothetical protein